MRRFFIFAILALLGAVRAPAAAPTLDAVQQRAFAFFWNESDPETGLTKDRARNLPGPADAYSVASIAATGYALAVLPVGVSHGWVSRRAAYARALLTLRFVDGRMKNNHGFLFHFVDKRTGTRVWKSELSSVDTALLLLGARVAGDYWPGTEVQRLADGLTDRVDWPWMRGGGEAGAGPTSLAMGWKPEGGWLKSRWQGYSEASFLYLLALGSRTHPLAPASWDAWEVKPAHQEGYAVFGGANPLFMAQMAPGFCDLRGLRDRQGRDWWAAWANAHRADIAYCARNPDKRRTYAEGFWGISANDQPPPVGYGASAPGHDDGTVSPTAMLSGFLFTPRQSRAALAALWSQHGDKLWGRYGYSNAFNMDKGWYDADVIGIDLGMMLLATENARTGLVWRILQADMVLVRGRAAAGLRRPSTLRLARKVPRGPVGQSQDTYQRRQNAKEAPRIFANNLNKRFL